MSAAKMEELKPDANSSYIYQNPLVNPTNGTKSIPPSPVLSTEMFWPELNDTYFTPAKKSSRSPGHLHIPRKADGWTEFVDHSEFIETMFHNVRKDIAQDQIAELAEVNNPTRTSNMRLKVKALDIGINRDASSLNQSTSGSVRISKPRKLEAPWRGGSRFATPSSLRKETFQNFIRMSPDPPTTPPKGDKQVKMSAEPPKMKPFTRRVEHTVVGRHLKLVPTPIDSTISIPPKHKSFPLPSNRPIQPGPSKLEKEKSLEKKPPVNVQALTAGGNSQPPQVRGQSMATFNTFQPPVKIQPILTSTNSKPPAKVQSILTSTISQPPAKVPTTATSNNYKPPVRPSVNMKPRTIQHPMPLSKRRETLPQNQPTLYHTLYYSGGRRTTAQMPPQMNVRKVFGNNSRKDVRISGDRAMPIKSQQNPSGPNNPQRRQTARRIRPAMLFPFHVPGPKHDNIYISDYHGSDTESEPEKPIVKGTKKDNISG